MSHPIGCNCALCQDEETMRQRIKARNDQSAEPSPNDRLLAAAPAMLKLCQKIITKYSLRGSGARHSYASPGAPLAGCSLSLEDIETARAAVELATGQPATIPD